MAAAQSEKPNFYTGVPKCYTRVSKCGKTGQMTVSGFQFSPEEFALEGTQNWGSWDSPVPEVEVPEEGEIVVRDGFCQLDRQRHASEEILVGVPLEIVLPYTPGWGDRLDKAAIEAASEIFARA